MNLYKIQHELIADLTGDGWYKVPGDGTSFHYRWQYGSNGDEPISYIIGEHHSHAVCRDEPSLTLSWGMDVFSSEDRRELKPDWAEHFVNSAVRPQWADFFWNNALIDRVELVSIDGAHGLIPWPRAGERLEVTHFEVAVAYLVHDLDGSPAHEHPGGYLEMIGATTVPDRERWGAGNTN